MAAISTALLLSACQKQVDVNSDISTGNTMSESMWENDVNSETPTQDIAVPEFVWEKQDYSGLEYNSSLYTYPDEYSLHSISTNMEVATVGKRTYGFEKAIAQEEREACIEATEIVLARVGYDGALNIYVYTDESGGGSYYIDEPEKSEGGNSFITCISDWKAVDYVTGVLLSANGKYANYGVAYGYANYLCDSLSDVWESVTDGADNNQKNLVSDTQSNELNYGQPVFNAEYNCYDLNLLCFDDDFVTADEIREAKAVSNKFVSDYIKNNGEDALKELLKKSGDVQLCHEFNDELEKWYNDNGLVLSNSLSEILYSYGGYSYQYIAYNGHAVFYMDSEWYDSTRRISDFFSETFLHENYVETNNFYKINTEQMCQYNELFGLGEPKLNVPILISEKTRNSVDEYAGIYYPDINKIYIKTVTLIMHEYIHALCVPVALSQLWVAEGWAQAFDGRYNYYYNKVNSDIMNNREDAYLVQYIEKNERPIDMFIDYENIMGLEVYTTNNYNYKEGYTIAASFFNYLCNVYGEKKIIDYVCHNHDLTTVTDKSLDELAEDWKNYIEDKYSEYSKTE